MKVLLRPGWLVLAFVVVGFATTCFLLLAPWQFTRHDERSATNAAIQSSFEAAPVPIESATGEWRKVTLTGSYLPEAEAVARLRTVQGAAAFEVLTPFRLNSGAVVLVNRGFVRPVEGVRVPSFAAAPSGEVSLVARLRVDERDPQGRPTFTEDGRKHVYAVDSRAVAAVAGITIQPGYAQLEEGSPGVLGALPLPQLDAGPYFSYALQWIAFGAMALLGLIYFTWREIKPGGALRTETPRRRTVAQILADDEAHAQ
ncbi:Cytochrome oxidase biogenesis protein Surf1, facilitates heme A insertion [Alloactinosynnema sp. L-07]|uniref:SURF1 family cytochrome oxidase biogenesis protein n=1 Tax=Alloactinosynnema sp. L-07 TaxID=1653480 RepID=UPI00065EF60D|nr:SURF1 family cytochrome oxidase biogenesis protein [Alloactinosynnema sp. L-07]CRK61822.1 Cytochrome oxidase biogenesis protein Surf1, facilitates heme A insertion [Alloactinosynnema sp. L-07]